jgi:large subunit ribosomal protein L19e
MQLTLQKRLAAQVMKCSPKKVHIDEERLEDVKEAITKRDIRGLIADRAITKKDTNEQSRFRARLIADQKRKGRQRGRGTRKGTKKARSNPKTEWIHRMRKQRKLLIELKAKNLLDKKTFRELYKKTGGGFFRSRRHLKLYITEKELVKK